jgi:glycerate 2-kinase
MRQRAFLEQLFRTAIQAAHPSTCLTRHLPAVPARGRLILLAAGKAAASMMEVAEHHYLDALNVPTSRITGLAVTRHGYGRRTRVVPVVEAGHPVPDAEGLAAAEKTLLLADAAEAQDLVLVLISGGASANWIAPAAGLTLLQKQEVTRALLKSGASIGEINTVRKHLSRIKGGRLAARAQPATIVTLAISDVPGDDPAIIGSGPTVPDPSTLADARSIIARHRLVASDAVIRALSDPQNESPKPHDRMFDNTRFELIARPADAFRAAADAVRAADYDCVFLGDGLEGEARQIAAQHARLAFDLRSQGRRAVILSGGELTVTISGNGRGGPNQEYALALGIALDGTRGIAALAGDTDGTDGGIGRADDPAGAYVDGTTGARGRQLGLDAAAFLANNDSTGFFTHLSDLVSPGPTFTNVNDFRAIIVDSP